MFFLFFLNVYFPTLGLSHHLRQAPTYANCALYGKKAAFCDAF
jgi:hypothetical protein